MVLITTKEVHHVQQGPYLIYVEVQGKKIEVPT